MNDSQRWTGRFEDFINIEGFQLLLEQSKAVCIGFDGVSTCVVFLQDKPDVNKGKQVDILPQDLSKFIDYFLNTLNYKSAMALGFPVFYAEDNDTVNKLILDLLERKAGL